MRPIVKRVGFPVDEVFINDNNGKYIKIVNGELTGATVSANATVPQYDTTDPTSPAAHDIWVLRSGSGGSIPDGTPIGLLLALTYKSNGGTAFTYQLSYQTEEGSTVRATLA